MKHPTYVYFAAPLVPRIIKIGLTAHPQNRLDDLAKYSPEPLQFLAMAPGGYRDEQHIHWLCRDYHSHFEWFFPHPFLQALIEDVRLLKLLPKYARSNAPSPFWKSDGRRGPCAALARRERALAGWVRRRRKQAAREAAE